ncbi:acyltransferase family protein [Pontixanthobacter aquaemixtae]|uniref:Acyltransferase family protein n=1 Tax=Pontixanthobacter aquaemixtae TaxID=1958940 RepID=A0A844ZRU9_9SPHN|nr:acyltransferase [Pontixanthobacter aquaemixtae]MXO90583.1 acyltransferase family protein [Pontixanthobacter aquaemixtae]
MKRTMWSKAREMAEMAPPERNRYVDFLRAFSILAVVVGHWLVAAPYMDESGAVQGGHLLGILPWTQWLTWGFQVMPIFFLVGGFSNGMSWTATKRKGGYYSDWFASRIQRLINPVFPVLLVWGVIAFFGTTMGIDRDIVRMATQLALIPVWFLAVYLLVTALTPLAIWLWERLSEWSMAVFVIAALLVDGLTFHWGVTYVNFLNFLFVWLAIHQFGVAWQNGFFEKFSNALWCFLASLLLLVWLVSADLYPVAMIGVPGAEITNSMPPTFALLALGVMQTGFAMMLQKPARKMLENIRIWTGVVLMNGMIMSIYLWHLTAFVLVMIAARLLGGVGLEVAPGSAQWWITRPVWFALYVAVTLPLIMLFVRFERGSLGGGAKRDFPVPHWRLVLGMVLICTGLAMTAAISIASPEGVTGVRLWVVALPFVGAALVGFGPVYRMVKG